MTDDPRPAELRTETVSLGPFRHVPDGELPPGHVVAERYELRDLLGRGGYGLVYEAVDRVCGRVVALKVLRADRWSEITVRRFRREAELVRHLHHPRLARVFDTGADGESLYLTMERVWGESLGCRLRRGPLPVEEALDVAIQVAEALEVLHGAGLVHRDVKPPNVLLDARGWVKLADFGLTRCAGAGAAELTGNGQAVGTAEYMAPEEALGEPLDARSDLYSLGVVLFETLTGEPPHLGRTPLGTLLAHLQQAAPDVRRTRPEVPVWLARVLARLLARRPEDRYPCAGALLDDLRSRHAAATGRGSKLRRTVGLGAVLGLAACAFAVQELRPAAELREVGSGPGGLSAVGPGGEVLWSLPNRTGELVRARLKPGEPERLVGIVVALQERGPEAVRRLTTFDEATGEPIRSVELVSGADAFEGFADRYGFRVAAVDLDGDGLDEILVSYSHTPYWPSYVVLYEPLLGRSRVAFLGSGHHRFSGAADVDGDGRPELILAGIINRLGYVPAVAAGRYPAAEGLFTRLAAGSEEVPDLAFDAARAFHLAGELERAVGWYRRGLGPGGMSSLGRGKWEFLEGLVFALDELGRPEEAAAESARRAVEELSHRIDDEVYGRTFRGLVEARASWARLRQEGVAAAVPAH
jgi:serine/threonine-protein kinase